MKNFIVRLLEGFTQLVLGLVRQLVWFCGRLLGRWLGPELTALAIILLLAWLVKVLFF